MMIRLIALSFVLVSTLTTSAHASWSDEGKIERLWKDICPSAEEDGKVLKAAPQAGSCVDRIVFLGANGQVLYTGSLATMPPVLQWSDEGKIERLVGTRPGETAYVDVVLYAEEDGKVLKYTDLVLSAEEDGKVLKFDTLLAEAAADGKELVYGSEIAFAEEDGKVLKFSLDLLEIHADGTTTLTLQQVE